MSFEEEPLVNRQIRSRQVRLIFQDRQLGVFPLEKALRMAEEAKLDLVEVSPSHNGPSVCKIVDYGKLRYEKQIKKKEQLKKQRVARTQIKELRLRPAIGEHDMNFKVTQAKKFLECKHKVQFSVIFRGQRELSHKERGFSIINQIISSLSDFGSVERTPRFDGNSITCVISPK